MAVKFSTAPAMKHRLALSLLLLCLTGTTGGALAQAYWRDVPPDERRQMRQQMRDHWHQERDVRRDDGGRRFQDVPPEDRRRLREEMREQRGWEGKHFEREGRGGRRD